MLSQREAARLWGVSRASLQRAISSGKLSVTGNKQIDPAEMTRVFGQAKGPAEPARASQNEPGESTQVATRIARLETENEMLREMLKRADAQLDQAMETVRLLGHEKANEPPPKSHWWPFGRRKK